MKSLRSLLFCLPLVLSFGVDAESVRVAAAHWKEFSEPGGKGIYLELIKRVYAGHDIHFDVGSFARAKRRFVAHDADILVGIFKEDLAHLDGAILPRIHLDMEFPVIAIYDPKKHQITKQNDLSRLVVGWYEEYNYGRFVPKNVVAQPFNDIGRGLYLLEAGRLDVVVDHEYNLDDKQRQTLQSMVLSGESPIWLAFKKTPRGLALQQQYDMQMIQLRDSGQLSAIFGSEYARAQFGEKFSH